MKSFNLISVMLILLLGGGCGADAPDCFKSSGDLEQVTLEVPDFSSITVFENVQLVVKFGPEQEVVLETGKNLRPDVTAEVVDGVLELRDPNSCNFFRSYGKTVFYVTTPSLSVIRSSTGWPIRSDGVLPFEDLTLISESFNNPETITNDGSFDLDLNVGRLTVVSNGIAYFKLKGQANRFFVNIAAGDSRVDAQELRAETVQVNHRGSNSISVLPDRRIFGTISGYGDVLSYQRPPEVDVEETFRGKLIFIE